MTQPFVTGVLKLNTNFPRLPGDIGNPESVNGTVILHTVANANPATVITGAPLPAPLVNAFVDGALALANQKVDLITTSCGFLLPLQSKLSSLSEIPVITSSLVLLPLLTQIHGPGIGVLTYDREKLIASTSDVNVTLPVAIEGLQADDTLRQTIALDHSILDRDSALQEVLQCATRLFDRWPDTLALVLECTNLSPYKHALREHTRRPVYDLIDTIHWQQHSRATAGRDLQYR